MSKVLKNQSGVALMIVLSSITILMAVATNFAYNTKVSYYLAKNDQERTQGYFLAESAIRLMALELKLEKQLRSSVGGAARDANLGVDLSAPLCEQFPLSSALIRAMFLGESEPGSEEEGTGESAAFIGGLQVEAAEEFLDFEGDFEGTCEDESAKFNLNVFYSKDPMKQALAGVNDYDKLKQLLMNLLMQPQYKNLFPTDRERDIREVTRNIADWVDKNDRINEFGATSTGNESSLYPLGTAGYSSKNAKFLSIEELYKVAAVTDDWFTPIKDRFTIYGDGKINVCRASAEMVGALILQYVNSNESIPNINADDKDKINNLVMTVQNSCFGLQPKPSDIEMALNQALGLTGTSGGGSSFSSMITTENRYYTLLGTGAVGDTVINIRAVLDTKDSQPKNWKFVYWRVE